MTQLNKETTQNSSRKDYSANNIRPALINFREKSYGRGVLVFLFSFLGYGTSFIGIALVLDIKLKILFSLLNGIFITILFITSHDACHGSLTPNKTLNKIIGRIGFLPSLHPFSMWVVGHNQIHHGYTNLKGKDYVWVPLSKMEFDHLPKWRQQLERFYRSPLGLGIYIIIEPWGKHIILPREEDWKKLQSIVAKIDYLSVFLFLGFQVWFLIFMRTKISISSSEAWGDIIIHIVMGIIIPFFFWSYLTGFLTYQHHTHPDIMWYQSIDEWSFSKGYVKHSAHIVFPMPINIFLFAIMKHVVHHIDTSIPFYNLADAHEKLETLFKEDVIIERFSISDFLKKMAVCKLYDYENHKWLDFDGKATTKSLVESIRN